MTFTCHIYSLFTAGITKGPESRDQCELIPDYYKFMHVVNLMDTVVTLIIPLVLIVLMNTLIAKNLIVFSRTFKKPRSPSSTHLNSIQVFIRHIATCCFAFSSFRVRHTKNQPPPNLLHWNMASDIREMNNNNKITNHFMNWNPLLQYWIHTARCFGHR